MFTGDANNVGNWNKSKSLACTCQLFDTVQHFVGCHRVAVRRRSGTGAAATSTPRGGAICPRLAATRSRYGCTAVITLAAGTSAHYVQVVCIDAWRSLWLCADISTLRCRATLDTAWKRASAVCGQYDMPWVSSRVGSSVLRRRSTSLEPTPCISSSHELCHNF